MLSQGDFPQSRPMSKLPLPPPPLGGGRGRGRGDGRGRGRGDGRGRGLGGGRGGGGGGRRGDDRANWVFFQTYDDHGNVVPLALDAPLPHQLSRAEESVIAAGVRERADAEREEKCLKRLHHNPDGPSDLFVTKGRLLDATSLEVPEGQKRIRKPVASREMPIPLSARAKMTKADQVAAAKDAELLKKLNGKKT
ncbi:hypothetical protein FB451DRAFT_1273164 [Mycena latifolia]|nr:hypothetical protein FB451DRAFT_1273164 [Mycena latifolia]